MVRGQGPPVGSSPSVHCPDSIQVIWRDLKAAGPGLWVGQAPADIFAELRKLRRGLFLTPPPPLPFLLHTCSFGREPAEVSAKRSMVPSGTASSKA